MIKDVIVVEGKNDTRRLQSFLDVDTIETHGLGLSKDIIEFIRKVNEERGVILLLDPDTPGEKLRKRLNDEITGLKNAFVLKEDARTSKKVGIEHASDEVILEALKHLISDTDYKETISLSDYYALGLTGEADSSEKREIISRHYHLGKCNGKTLLKRLNMARIRKEEIEELLKEI